MSAGSTRKVQRPVSDLLSAFRAEPAERPLASVTEACRVVLDHLTPTATEVVRLDEARGRVLGTAVHRRFPQPPFTRSRVDGYALSLQDLEQDLKACDGGPPRLEVFQTVLAGSDPPPLLPRGKVLRVMAGSALPEGIGAVVPFEEVPEGNGGFPGDTITIHRRPACGENVIPAGREGHAGEVLLKEGTLLGPVEMGLLASAGEPEVCVVRRPRVSVIATGSELVPVGKSLPPAKIYASNTYLLSGLVAAWGGEAKAFAPIPDDWRVLSEMLKAEADASDLVIVTGGAAGGDADLSHRAVTDLGWSVLIDGADFHPGGRCVVTQVPGAGGPLVFFLSGGPGACLTAAAFLVVPAVATLGARKWGTVKAFLGAHPEEASTASPSLPPSLTLPLLSSARGRRRAVPVKVELTDGKLLARPQPRCPGAPAISQGTDGFILLPFAREQCEVWPVHPMSPVIQYGQPSQ